VTTGRKEPPRPSTCRIRIDGDGNLSPLGRRTRTVYRMTYPRKEAG
jgi:hypothetical protein